MKHFIVIKKFLSIIISLSLVITGMPLSFAQEFFLAAPGGKEIISSLIKQKLKEQKLTPDDYTPRVILRKVIASKISGPLPESKDTDKCIPDIIQRLLKGDKSAKYELVYLLLDIEELNDVGKAIVKIFEELSKGDDSEYLFDLYVEFLRLYESLSGFKIDLDHAVAVGACTIDGIGRLSAKGFKSAADFLEKLIDRYKNGFFGICALQASAMAGRHVSECFAHHNASIRLHALGNLVNFMPKDKAGKILLGILKDSDELSKIYAAWGLGFLHYKDASSLLQQNCHRTNNISLKRACAWALKNMGYSLKKMGIEVPPLYDINNLDEKMDFNKFRPLSAQKGNETTIEDIEKQAREKMAKYPYLSGVYMVKVDGEYAKASKRKELKGILGKEIVNKISYMAVPKPDAERFYNDGHTIAIMFQISPVHGRAVVDVDKNGNWYAVKGVGLLLNTLLNIPHLWERPVYTSNTQSGLSEVNPNDVKRLKNNPLAIEAQGGDISKFMAANRFRSMVSQDGKSFVEPPSLKNPWRLKSDDENAPPNWSPIFIPGTRLIFLGKEPRRINDIIALPMPKEVKIDWILSELGFLKLEDSTSQYDGLKSYFTWLAEKLGREIANVINAERSHYFLSHMHNTTLSGKLVDFESLQCHDWIDRKDVIDFVDRDLEHIKFMIGDIFNNIIENHLVKSFEVSQDLAGKKDFDIILFVEKAKAIFLKAVKQNIRKDKRWLLRTIKIRKPDLTGITTTEMIGYEKEWDLDAAIGARVGNLTFLLEDELHDFIVERGGEEHIEVLPQTVRGKRVPISKTVYRNFLKQLKSKNPDLHRTLETLGDKARIQLNSIILHDAGTIFIFPKTKIREPQASILANMPFLDILFSLQEGDEEYTWLSAGLEHLFNKHEDIAELYYRYCKPEDLSKEEFFKQFVWQDFWIRFYREHNKIFRTKFGKALRELINKDPAVGKMVSVYNEIVSRTVEEIPEFAARLDAYFAENEKSSNLELGNRKKSGRLALSKDSKGSLKRSN